VTSHLKSQGACHCREVISIPFLCCVPHSPRLSFQKHKPSHSILPRVAGETGSFLIPHYVKSTMDLWASATLIPVSHDLSLLLKLQKLESSGPGKLRAAFSLLSSPQTLHLHLGEKSKLWCTFMALQPKLCILDMCAQKVANASCLTSILCSCASPTHTTLCAECQTSPAARRQTERQE